MKKNMECWINGIRMIETKVFAKALNCSDPTEIKYWRMVVDEIKAIRHEMEDRVLMSSE